MDWYNGCGKINDTLVYVSIYISIMRVRSNLRPYMCVCVRVYISILLFTFSCTTHAVAFITFFCFLVQETAERIHSHLASGFSAFY